MPQYDEDHVKVIGGIVTYEGITQPETVKFSDGSSGTKYEMSIGLERSNPDLALVEALQTRALLASKWKGQLPAGAHRAVKAAPPSLVNAGLGHLTVIKAVTYYQPDVYDEHGARLEPMQYGPALYPGQRVDILISCKDYDNVSKGIKAQLDGFQIIASANAPRLSIGGDGVAAGAFAGGGGQPAQPQQAQQQQQQAQPQQSTDFMPPGPNAAPAGPGAPAGPATAPEPKYNDGSGSWTRAQLLGAGYSDAQIDALPPGA